MNKREFLKQLGIAGIVMSSGSISLQGCKYPKGKHWVWIRPDKTTTEAELVKQYTKLKDYHINGILFGSDNELHFRVARKLGFETHLWWWTLNTGESPLMQEHPEWYTVNRLGVSCVDHPPYVDYYRWLCPSRDDVQAYLMSKVEAFCKKDYIDGIHLDYVRYCDVILPKALWPKYNLVQNSELPEFDYCYCEVCRARFREKFDLLDDKDKSETQAWKQYRYDTVTNVVNQLSELVHQNKKIISAAVFPTPEIALKLVRQDWLKWKLDMVFPMIYQGFYLEDIEWIGEATRKGVEALGGEIPLYAGLYLPDLPKPENLRVAAEDALASGAAGISLFGEVSEDHWEAFTSRES